MLEKSRGEGGGLRGVHPCHVLTIEECGNC